MTPEERAHAWLEQHDPNRSGEAIIATLADAIREAVAEEREACAQIAEGGTFLQGGSLGASFREACAAAIRLRSRE